MKANLYIKMLLCCPLLFTEACSDDDDKPQKSTNVSVVSFNIRVDNPVDGDNVWENRKNSRLCWDCRKHSRTRLPIWQKTVRTTLGTVWDATRENAHPKPIPMPPRSAWPFSTGHRRSNCSTKELSGFRRHPTYHRKVGTPITTAPVHGDISNTNPQAATSISSTRTSIIRAKWPASNRCC